VCKRASHLLVVLTVIFAISGSNALAQFLDPRVTVFAGGSFLGGERGFIISGNAFQSQFQNGGKAGGRVTADLTDSWSLEGTYSFSGNDLRITELDEVPPEERFFGIGVHQFVVNGLYYITPPGETLRFFFTAGIGWVRFSPSETAKILALVDQFIDDSASIRTSNKFGFNFGAGMETRANEWLGVRVDLRDHITGYPRFGLPESSSGPGGLFFPVEGVLHNTEVSAGVVFYLP
jgi:opacity protein-like surface antigen